MATRRTVAAPPPDYWQAMVVALSAPALPGGGCFRPFEREGLTGLGQPGAAQKGRMVELAALLSEQSAKRVMLEILWAWPRDNIPYQIAPPLPLGHCLQGVLLGEAERRGMLRITCVPAQDGSEGASTLYHPVDRSEVEGPSRKEVDRAKAESFFSLMGGEGMPLLVTLSPLDYAACCLVMYSLLLSDWQRRLLPVMDQELLLQPLLAELVARMQANQNTAQDIQGKPLQEQASVPAEEGALNDAATEQDAYCRLFLARLHCANYRWLQSEDEKEQTSIERPR